MVYFSQKNYLSRRYHWHIHSYLSTKRVSYLSRMTLYAHLHVINFLNFKFYHRAPLCTGYRRGGEVRGWCMPHLLTREAASQVKTLFGKTIHIEACKGPDPNNHAYARLPAPAASLQASHGPSSPPHQTFLGARGIELDWLRHSAFWDAHAYARLPEHPLSHCKLLALQLLRLSVLSFVREGCSQIARGIKPLPVVLCTIAHPGPPLILQLVRLALSVRNSHLCCSRFSAGVFRDASRQLHPPPAAEDRGLPALRAPCRKR